MDSQCEKGIFVGSDKNSPAYLVFYPDSVRNLTNLFLITFPECHTQPDQLRSEDVVRRESAEIHLPKTEVTKPIPQEIKTEVYVNQAPTQVKGKVLRVTCREREETSSVVEGLLKCDDDH